MLTKIICIGLVTVIVSSIIKQYRADISLLVNICGSMLIVMIAVSGVSDIIDSMIQISENISISSDVISPIVKVLSIGYITEFSADIADDAGNKSISSKILFGGKIAICVVAVPIVINMLNAILSLL